MFRENMSIAVWRFLKILVTTILEWKLLGFQCIYCDHQFYKLKSMGLNVSEVELFETPTNSCTYSED